MLNVALCLEVLLEEVCERVAASTTSRDSQSGAILDRSCRIHHRGGCQGFYLFSFNIIYFENKLRVHPVLRRLMFVTFKIIITCN